MKNFYAMPAGTCFKALILDIQPGRITIRLDEGGKFTARSLILPDARIGEESYFRVKVNNFDGLIQLEMIKGTPEARQDNLVQEALKDAGLYNVAENIEIGRALMEKNLPLDPQTLQKTAFFRHYQPEEGFVSNESAMEKAVFLLQEGFPADASSLLALDAILDPNRHLTKMLEGKSEQFFLNLDENPKPLRQYYRGLLKFREMQQHLEFMKQVSTRVRYYQIPFIRQEQTGQGELFLYNEKNAIIALDTHALGRVEVLTNKDNKQLTFQFSGDTDAVLNLIKGESPKLINTLQQKGFQISGLTYQKRKERTTVLTPSPTQTTKTDTRRYAFDMRV